MCETERFSHHMAGPACCCGEKFTYQDFRRHHHFRPSFPTKAEQIEQLKKYKQTLTEEIGEIDKRLKDLE